MLVIALFDGRLSVVSVV